MQVGILHTYIIGQTNLFMLTRYVELLRTLLIRIMTGITAGESDGWDSLMVQGPIVILFN